MTKYEIDVGEEFPLGARLAREIGEQARGFTGKVFIGGLLFVSLAAIAISHPVTTLIVILAFVAVGKAHRHYHLRRAHYGYYDSYWRRGPFDGDFL